MESVVTTVLSFGLGALLATAQEPISIEVAREFIQSHCIDCHNDRKQKGETNLTPFLQDESSVGRDLLLTVYNQLNLEEMPPEEEAQPTSDERGLMLGFLKESIQASGTSNIDKNAPGLRQLRRPRGTL